MPYERLEKDAQLMEEAGVTHMTSAPWLYGKVLDYTDMTKGATVTEMIDGIKRFADEVIAKMR